MRITIVGSSVFAKEMALYREKLMRLGHQVNLHEHYIAQAKGEMTDLVKRMQREHAQVKKEFDYLKYYYRKINESDAILVLNFDKNEIANYIGGNTLMEIGFAHVHDKKIFLLNPIPEITYKDEIEACEPIIIDQDLNKIR